MPVNVRNVAHVGIGMYTWPTIVLGCGEVESY